MSDQHQEHKETILGAATSFKGKITFHSALTIKGSFDGEIKSDGDLSIEETAAVKASVEASNLEVLGSLYGNAQVTGHIEIGPSGSLIGDIKTSSIKIDQGAIYRGRISMLKNAETIDVFSTSPEQLKKIALTQHEQQQG